MPSGDQKVNCRVHNVADGSKHLVFTVAGTSQCVGELRLTGDPQYLLVMASLFSQWASMERRRPIAPSPVRHVLGGH